jgi:hypothetical protein
MTTVIKGASSESFSLGTLTAKLKTVASVTSLVEQDI